jgi:hypothetical protein
MLDTEPRRELLKPTKYFVEFGHGGKPAPIIYDSNFNSEYYYVGIDINSENSADGYSKTALTNPLRRPNVAFIEGNKPFYELVDNSVSIPKSKGIVVGSLPEGAPIINQLGMLRFKDNSVDKVLIANTLGSPRIQRNQNLILLFEDILRCIKTNGNLIIAETRTPYDLEKLKFMAKHYRLKLEKLIYSDDADFEKEIQPYNAEGNSKDHKLKQYIAFYQKTSETNTFFDLDAHFN